MVVMDGVGRLVLGSTLLPRVLLEEIFELVEVFVVLVVQVVRVLVLVLGLLARCLSSPAYCSPTP